MALDRSAMIPGSSVSSRWVPSAATAVQPLKHTATPAAPSIWGSQDGAAGSATSNHPVLGTRALESYLYASIDPGKDPGQSWHFGELDLVA